jgi:hypothetical protein
MVDCRRKGTQIHADKQIFAEEENSSTDFTDFTRIFTEGHFE